MQLQKRFYQLPQDHCFIFGPRGTGKSTWITTHLPGAYVINLLDAVTFRTLVAHPEHIKAIVAANPNVHQYVIDEVQKIPNILNSIHELIENSEYSNRQFILIGSSARQLRRQGVNLLGGRALLTHFHPFMAAEMGDYFDLNQALQNGLIPLVVAAKEPREKIAAYINPSSEFNIIKNKWLWYFLL